MKFLYETDRLILKILDSSYAQPVCSFYLHNRSFFEAVEPPRVSGFYTEEFQRATLVHELEQIRHKNYLRLYLFEKSNPGHIIGSICFNNIRYGCFQSCTIGYKTDKDYCNKGYITEALSYSIYHILYAEFPIHRIEAMVLPDNSASIRVLEKLGFTAEGIARDYARLNGRWRSHIRYALIRI